jgi:Flp pilus assembly pilin Flp
LVRVVHDSVAIAVEQGLVVARIALVIIAGVSAFGALVNRALVNRALVNRASVKGRSRVRGVVVISSNSLRTKCEVKW